MRAIFIQSKKGYFVSDNVLIKNTNPRLISNKDIKNDNYLFSFKTSNIDSTVIPTNTLKKSIMMSSKITIIFIRPIFLVKHH